MNRLTEIELHHRDSKGRQYSLYQCDCGNQKIIHKAAVTRGNTRSCGCLKEDSNKNKRLPNNQGIINQIILGYKRHAERRNLEFNLSFEEVAELVTANCHYCGDKPSNLKVTKNYLEGFSYSGIDRVDSSLGYKKENCVPCCKVCNRAKSNSSVKEFIDWAKRVVEQWG